MTLKFLQTSISTEILEIDVNHFLALASGLDYVNPLAVLQDAKYTQLVDLFLSTNTIVISS